MLLACCTSSRARCLVLCVGSLLLLSDAAAHKKLSEQGSKFEPVGGFAL